MLENTNEEFQQIKDFIQHEFENAYDTADIKNIMTSFCETIHTCVFTDEHALELFNHITICYTYAMQTHRQSATMT